MPIIYVDAFSGAGGDMLLGALLDAGLPEAGLRECLARLPVGGYRIDVRRERRLGISATRAEVHVEAHGHSHHGHEGHVHGRRLPEIEAMIAQAGLPGRAAEWATAVFRRLAQAEAKVHGSTPEEVHFHEVGAVDSIVDIVGVCAGLAMLGVERIVSSPLPMGSGYVDCAHGRFPVPAPAVVELMKGRPTRDCPETGELTTPTGAAILVTLAEAFGPMPPMTCEEAGAEADSVWLLEANLDDATGETLGATTRSLFAAGALDVWLTPVTMKKGRPGVVLACLAEDAALAAVEDTIFSETTTFGVRRSRVVRTKLAREHVEVRTPFGPVRVKVGRRGGRIVTALPEYDDCVRLAEEKGVAFRDVYEAARAAWAKRQG
ncbi:MAG: LarC family nickel insertion protein [Planctomycetota bacterium]|nr:LarC family nickel insertion protein [Planctomycetota bacterium]